MSRLEVDVTVWGSTSDPATIHDAVIDTGASRTVVGEGLAAAIRAPLSNARVAGRDFLRRPATGRLYRIVLAIDPGYARCTARVDAFVPDGTARDFSILLGADVLQAVRGIIDLDNDSFGCTPQPPGVAPAARRTRATVHKRPNNPRAQATLVRRRLEPDREFMDRVEAAVREDVVTVEFYGDAGQRRYLGRYCGACASFASVGAVAMVVIRSVPNPSAFCEACIGA